MSGWDPTRWCQIRSKHWWPWAESWERKFVSSCPSELQVAIAGGMAILSWEAQSVGSSTAEHRTCRTLGSESRFGLRQRCATVGDAGTFRRTIFSVERGFKMIRRSYKGASLSAVSCEIVGIPSTFANSRFCPCFGDKELWNHEWMRPVQSVCRALSQEQSAPNGQAFKTSPKQGAETVVQSQWKRAVGWINVHRNM